MLQGLRCGPRGFRVLAPLLRRTQLGHRSVSTLPHRTPCTPPPSLVGLPSSLLRHSPPAQPRLGQDLPPFGPAVPSGSCRLRGPAVEPIYKGPLTRPSVALPGQGFLPFPANLRGPLRPRFIQPTRRAAVARTFLAMSGEASTLPPVLVILPLMDRLIESISEFAQPLALPQDDKERASFIAQHGPYFRGVVTTSFNGFPSALFDQLPKLEMIANFGVGVDSIDVTEAHSRSIKVSNTPEVLTDDVADIALGLILCVSRRLCEGDRYVRAKRWPKEGFMHLTTKVSGKTVGIMGLGRIGMAIAKRAEAFDCKIEYFSRSPKAGVPYVYHPNPVSLAMASDFLVVACALTPETTHIVNEGVLAALGPKGVLINIGRGGHVDEPALVRALQGNVIGGAGLDVFADEPNVPEELMGMEQVVLLPHVGSGTEETRGEMADLTAANLRAHFEGKPLLTPV